jgi:hypothetical protein
MEKAFEEGHGPHRAVEPVKKKKYIYIFGSFCITFLSDGIAKSMSKQIYLSCF